LVYIIIGVSGCGKTTIGKALASQLGISFLDADSYHTSGNVRKMKGGFPLNDKDRIPWLTILSGKIFEWSAGKGGVLACSALKQSYRELLCAQVSQGDVCFVYLQISYESAYSRLQLRTEHFFPLELLQSQFETLEEPTSAIVIEANASPETIVNSILDQLRKDKLYLASHKAHVQYEIS